MSSWDDFSFGSDSSWNDFSFGSNTQTSNWNDFSYTSPFADTGAVSKVDLNTALAPPGYIGSQTFNFQTPQSQSQSTFNPNSWDNFTFDSPFKPTGAESKVDLNSALNPPGYLGSDFFEVPKPKPYEQVKSEFNIDDILPWKHPLRALNVPYQFVIGTLNPYTFKDVMSKDTDPSQVGNKFWEAGTRSIMEDKSTIEYIRNLEGMSNETYRKAYAGQSEWTQMAKDPGLASMALVTSSALDPMSYAADFMIKPVGWAARGGGKIIANIAGKAVEAELPILSTGIKKTAQFFNKYAYRSAGEKTILNLFDDAQKWAKSESLTEAEKSLMKEQIVTDAARKTGWDPGYIHKQLDDMIELKIPKENIQLFPREPMPYVKPATEGDRLMVSQDPLSDPPKISFQNTPIVQANDFKQGAFNYSPKTKMAFTNIVGTAFGEDTPAVTAQLGGRLNKYKSVGFFTPDKPLYVNVPDNLAELRAAGLIDPNDVSYTGLSQWVLPKFYEKDVANSIMKSPAYAKSVAKELGITADEIKALEPRHIDLVDRIVRERAVQEGYDSIYAINSTGVHGEVAILNEQSLPKAIPDQIEKALPFKGDIEAIRARMQYWRPDEANKIPNEIYQLASDQVKTRLARFADEVNYGLLTPELEDEAVSYLTHVVTKDARKEMAKFFPDTFQPNGKVINPSHASQLYRSIVKAGINNINERATAGTLGELSKRFEGFVMPEGKKFLIDNPIMLEAYRHKRGLEGMADAKVVWGAVDQLALPKEQFPDGVQLRLARSTRPEDAVFVEKLKDLRFHKDDAAMLDQLITFYNYPKEQMAFVKLFETTRDIWTKGTMNFSPSTWSRNMIGNLFNNYLAGLKDPRYYEMAKQYKDWKEAVLKDQIGKGGKEYFILNGKKIKFSELDKQLKYTGVEGGGFATVEAEGRWEALNAAESKGAFGKLKKAWSAANKPGRATNVYFEDISRVAHYLYRMDSGMNPIKSAESVKKYLFDYVSGLNKTEQVLWRKSFPLMTFTRMNIPLQVQGVMGLTDTFMPYIRFSQFANLIRTHDTVAPKIDKKLNKLTPDLIKENVGVNVVKDGNGVYNFLLFGGLVPASDLYYLSDPKSGFDRIKNSTHVLVREIAQQASNKDWFTDKPIDWGQIDRFMGAEWGGLGLNVKHVLKNARVLNDLDQIAQSFYEDPRRLTTTQKNLLEKTLQKVFGLTFTKVDYNMESKYWQYKHDELLRKWRSARYKGDTANMENFARQIKEMEDSIK